MRGVLKTGLATFIVALLSLASTTGSALAISVTVTGPKEVVFDYDTMRCDLGDYPDGTAQPFRDSTGRLQLLTGSRRMVGTNFNDLVSDCARGLMVSSPLDPNPAHYRYLRWLGAVWTENGRDVYALVHNEWHGWDMPPACPAGPGKRRCGVVGVTYAESHDNGDSFVEPIPPENFVATVPPRPVIDDIRTGLACCSTPIKRGNYWYSFGFTTPNSDRDGVCLMRTPSITDPGSWRGWDGTSFSVRFENPYYENVAPLQTHACEPLDYNDIQMMMRTVTFNTYLNKYVLTGNAIKYDPVRGQVVYGFYYSTSDDLIDWSMREVMLEVPTLTSHQCGGPDAGAYPSLVDHDSTDPTYRTGDATMYLYYVDLHFNAACQLTGDRDMVRVPVQFSQ
jgi:hypothetical protein